MKKNEIYVEMLGRSLAYIRNVQSLNTIRKVNDISCYYEAELVHNLVLTILEPNFSDHDIWFLNHQAKLYCDNCSSDISINYQKQVFYIRELFKLVPNELRDQLTWLGPQ